MSQRALFAGLFAGLLVACEDVDHNAVSQTKYGLLAGAEYALLTADQADTLAARLAVFADSAHVFADSVDSAEILFALNAYDTRFALSKAAAYTHYATRDGGKDAVYEASAAVHSSPAVIAADEAYKAARRAAASAFQAYASAYDTRNARLIPRAYNVAQRAAEQTASIARRAADQAAKKAITSRRAADQAAKKAATSRRAADQAANEAKRAAKVYADQTTRLRRAYNKATVQAAYDVACAAAYDATYQAYSDNDGLDDADQDARMIASAASRDRIRFSDKAKRSAHANYVDSVSGEVAYEVASALFDAAYRADGNDPQAYAAQAYAAAAKKASRIAARDSVYVKSPISIATAALTASAAAYRASASYIDSVLKFHQIEFSTAAKDHYSYYGRKFGY